MSWFKYILILSIFLLEVNGQSLRNNEQRMMKKMERQRKRMARCKQMVSPFQEELEELQEKFKSISNPVHVHLHGDGEEDSASSTWSVDEQAHHSNMNSEDKSGGANSGSHVHIHLNVATGVHNSGKGHGHKHEHKHGGESHQCGTMGYPKHEYIHAKCKMIPHDGTSIGGFVYLRQKPGEHVEIKVNMYGFPLPRSLLHTPRGFHVHEFGDLENGCLSFGGHFNSDGHAHGGPDSHHRHDGDWGNIQSDLRGVVNATFTRDAFLYGPKSVIGRGIVVHSGEDDHGHGRTDSSKRTGNAGGRDACCIISHSNGERWNQN